MGRPSPQQRRRRWQRSPNGRRAWLCPLTTSSQRLTVAFPRPKIPSFTAALVVVYSRSLSSLLAASFIANLRASTSPPRAAADSHICSGSSCSHSRAFTQQVGTASEPHKSVVIVCHPRQFQPERLFEHIFICRPRPQGTERMHWRQQPELSHIIRHRRDSCRIASRFRLAAVL